MFGLLNLANDEIEQELIDLQQRDNLKLHRRHIRDGTNPFEIDDFNFKKLFRLSKPLASELCDRLDVVLRQGTRSTSIPNHLKVFTALSFYASGCYQTAVGHDMNLALSQPSVSRTISEVSEAICNNLLHQKIIFPNDRNSSQLTKEEFYNKYNMPNVIGCVDGTHVPIICPPMDHPVYPGTPYYNRKGYTSLNVQIICNAALKITAINARYPGSTHDAAIWRTSNIQEHLRRRYLAGEEGTWLLGDSGYPLQPWLLTPIVDAVENTPEAQYTVTHCRTRNVVERAIGVLKGRFRCLTRHRVLHYSPPKAGQIIYACAVLHNMCIDFNIKDHPAECYVGNGNDVAENVNVQVNGEDLLAQATRIRQQLIHDHFPVL